MLRRRAVVTGTLFILGIVTVLISTSLTDPLTDKTRVLVGVLFQFASALVSAGIAVSLYPTLREHSHGLAMGAVAFRIIEAVFYTISAAGTVVLTKDPSMSAAINTLRNSSNFIFGVLSFSVGATLYYVVLYRSRLIPRWLSGWGLAAIVPLVIASLIACFTTESFAIEGKTQALAVPIALQEMVLGVWLIAKGFNDLGPNHGLVSRPDLG